MEIVAGVPRYSPLRPQVLFLFYFYLFHIGFSYWLLVVDKNNVAIKHNIIDNLVI